MNRILTEADHFKPKIDGMDDVLLQDLEESSKLSRQEHDRINRLARRAQFMKLVTKDEADTIVDALAPQWTSQNHGWSNFITLALKTTIMRVMREIEEQIEKGHS